MRPFLLFNLLLLINFCSGQNDSVVIIGQFVNTTGNFPKSVTLVSASDSKFEQSAAVGSYGQFRFIFQRGRPSFYIFQTGDYSNAFPIGKSESLYRIEVIGDAAKVTDIQVEDSRETEAFHELIEPAKRFGYSMEAAFKQCGNDNSCEQNITPVLKSMHENAISVSKKFPDTYVGGTLVHLFDFYIPRGASDYRSKLKQDFLKQIKWNDVSTYDNFFVGELFTLYEEFFSDTTEQGINSFILSLYSQAPDTMCAGKLSNFLFGSFLSAGKEREIKCMNQLARGGKILLHDEVLQARLESMSGSLSGNRVIDLNLKNAAGKIVSLTEKVKQSPLTLLIFWSPTCSHCKAEMPHVKDLYGKYHSKGLEIYAVAIEADSADWNSYINENQLTWNNVNYRHGEDNDNVEKYFIMHTPTFVLIDNEGTILSRLGEFAKIEKLVAGKL